MDHDQTVRDALAIRNTAGDDAEQARPLMKRLGYDPSVEEFRRRYEAVAADDRHVLLVAERAGRLVALLHAYARPAIDKPPCLGYRVIATSHLFHRVSTLGLACPTS